MSEGIFNQTTHLFCGLERVNQIIDLCIDRELFDYVEGILLLDKNCLDYIEELRRTKGKEPFKNKNFFREVDYPVIGIRIPSAPEKACFFKTHQLFKSCKPPFNLNKKGKDAPLLWFWSSLFWAKRIRAELLKWNRGKWINRYEELIFFLETRMPANKPLKSRKADFYITQFNYLMELSAVAQGDASLGYAERARKLLKPLFSDYKALERGPYDRWIWWNIGLAHQHIGNSQKAVIHFNKVINKFGNNIETIDTDLEYLLNIVPAFLQRAAINLKLQLGYHALQTLENGIDDALDKIAKRYSCELTGDAIKHLQNRIKLHRIEALLQLEILDKAEEQLKASYKDKTIFDKELSCLSKIEIPSKTAPPLGAIKTQLIEHIINWLHQRAGQLPTAIGKYLSLSKDSKNFEEISQQLKQEAGQNYECLIALLEKFEGYFELIKGNNEDERIFFSRWAQLLKLGVGTIKKLHEIEQNQLSELHLPADASNQILTAMIKLYLSQSSKLPVIRKERLDKYGLTIELENLRSDDLPDFTSGLSTFYELMSDILIRSEAAASYQHLKKVAEKILVKKLNKEGAKVTPRKYLKGHHTKLLEALDEFEEEFGENQRIKALKRFNERLFWCKDKEKCKGCLKETNKTAAPTVNIDDPEKPYYFNGLLACHEDPEKRKRRFLYHDDYQNIMQKSEKSLIKHLESPSKQNPLNKALHFVGLQRWNSLTPAQGRSVGGGYLIYRTDQNGQVDLGIAVDPGFDFVRNLFRMGFSLRDIDIVIISHAHADHLWDFETLVQLAHELEGKKKIIHRFNVIMTLGIYERLSHIIKNSTLRRFINPLVVDIRKEVDMDVFWKNIDDEKYSFKFKNSSEQKSGTTPVRWQPILSLPGEAEKAEIEILPTRAYHEDYSNISDSFGFKIIFYNNSDSSNENLLCFGYTGDTKWVGEDLYPENWGNVANQYKDCDVLLFHIGSLIDHKNKNKKNFSAYASYEECAKLIRKENHPYLMGTLRFLKKLQYPGETTKNNHLKPIKQNKLIFIGEFGEELRGGIRTDLVKRLQGEGPSTWPILPVDVGFDVLLHNYKKPNNDGFKFLCALCDEYCPVEEIDYFRFGQDEAIFHVCKTCLKATPADVRETKLRKLYETGRELQTLPDTYQ